MHLRLFESQAHMRRIRTASANSNTGERYAGLIAQMLFKNFALANPLALSALIIAFLGMDYADPRLQKFAVPAVSFLLGTLCSILSLLLALILVGTSSPALDKNQFDRWIEIFWRLICSILFLVTAVSTFGFFASGMETTVLMVSGADSEETMREVFDHFLQSTKPSSSPGCP